MLKVEYIMKERGLSQTDIAKASGVHRVTVNRITRGKELPSEYHAQKIAKAMDWQGDWHELFDEIEVR